MVKKPLLPFNISFKAQKDLNQATKWYNEQSWMLGLEFVDFIEKKIRHIRKVPHEFRFISPNVQGANLKKLPYGIFFTKEENRIIILRMRHNKQVPLRRFR